MQNVQVSRWNNSVLGICSRIFVTVEKNTVRAGKWNTSNSKARITVARLNDPDDAVKPLRRRDLRSIDVSQSVHEDMNRLKVIRRTLERRRTSSASLTEERREIWRRLLGDLNLHELAELSHTDASFVKREVEK
jgi:hypothetical protein